MDPMMAVNAGVPAAESPAAGDPFAGLEAELGAYFDAHGAPDEGEPEAGEWEEGAEDGPGSAIPGADERSPFIPRPRFDEVVNERNTLREQVQGLEPWQQVIQGLQALGLSPEQIAAQLEDASSGMGGVDHLGTGSPDAAHPGAEAGAQSEDEAFSDYLMDLGIDDPFELEEPVYRTLQNQFRLEQRLRGFEQYQAQAERQAAEQQLQNELRSVQSQFPMFQDPNLQRALIGQLYATNGTIPMAQIAEGMARSLETAFRNQLSQAALQHQSDAQRPQTAGGGTPPVAEDTSWITDGDEETFERNARGMIGRLFQAGRKTR